MTEPFALEPYLAAVAARVEAERRVEELLRAEDGSVTSRPLGEEG